jgi:hypothetical protein
MKVAQPATLRASLLLFCFFTPRGGDGVYYISASDISASLFHPGVIHNLWFLILAPHDFAFLRPALLCVSPLPVQMPLFLLSPSASPVICPPLGALTLLFHSAIPES